MTPRAGTLPKRMTFAWIVGAPLVLLLTLTSASIVAWVVLGLPIGAYEPLKMPYFFWYYRGDARVMNAFAGGTVAGGAILAFLISAHWAQSRLGGAARSRGQRRVHRNRFPASSGIVLHVKGCKVLPSSGPYRVTIEAPSNPANMEIRTPTLLTRDGSVLIDVTRTERVGLIFVDINCGS